MPTLFLDDMISEFGDDVSKYEDTGWDKQKFQQASQQADERALHESVKASLLIAILAI